MVGPQIVRFFALLLPPPDGRLGRPWAPPDLPPSVARWKIRYGGIWDPSTTAGGAQRRSRPCKWPRRGGPTLVDESLSPPPLRAPLGSPTPERQRDPSNHPASPSPDTSGKFGPPVMRRGGATADAGADLTASAEAHRRRLERAAPASRTAMCLEEHLGRY